MRVLIETVSRLHFGFTSLGGDMGRCYGSIGVALDYPWTSLEIAEADKFHVSGASREKVLSFVEKFSDRYAIDPQVSIEVQQSIPEHSGLGSGTQLALAIAVSLAKIYEINEDLKDLSIAMGRGKRSGIGIAAFDAGGFIVDAGHKKGTSHCPVKPPTVVFRHDFPGNWCFLIVIPDAKRGLNGPGEDDVFGSLPPSMKISEEICRVTHLRLLPALIEKDIVEFGSALTEIDQKTGMYFEGTQGGMYAETTANDIIDTMLRAGAYGAGQSSWGPAIYGLVDESCAKRVEDEVTVFMKNKGNNGSVFVSYGCNRGAQVDVQT